MNTMTTFMMSDVLNWARAQAVKKDALYELEKIPARLGYLDEEIGLIPADLAYFERHIAPSPYGAVSKAADLDKARKRGNSRIRSLLGRFHEAHGTRRTAPSIRDSYTKLIEFICAHEGFVEEGALFTKNAHKPFVTLRARARVALPDLDQAEIDRLWSEATPDGRRSLRRALLRILELHRKHNILPGLAGLLPHPGFVIPSSPDRARRIEWKSLPTDFRSDAEAVFSKTLRKASDLKAWAREQLKAGRTAVEIDAEIAALKKNRKRTPKNPETASAGYRQATTWLLREQTEAGDDFATLPSFDDLFSTEVLDVACAAQIERSRNSSNLKNPDKSSTLWSRITNLKTIARHGLQSKEALAALNVIEIVYDDFILSPRAMTAEVEAVVDRLRLNPHLAAVFVNSPDRLHEIAEKDLAEAKKGTWGEEQALRLHASAAARAIQVSRPLRTSNLFYARIRATKDTPRNVIWVKDRAHAEIRFAGVEVKNGQTVIVNVVGADAEILWDWQKVHRPRLLELRDLEDSPYLFPGTATPRLRSDRMRLPPGAMSVAAIAELWDLGERHLGHGMTPHQCRHAVATLHLAVHPGDYATVASILCNSEEIARKHYGKDSGQQAAQAVRAALLAKHPDIFRRLKGNLP
ncbi:site-specific integrase [Primorskyibacter sp. 2E107]|uniref:site-specific integrase n=1 Tax=Primorskyibacter sp. 2E107 TaxID=3403458 RepID=UPI003AF5B5EE